jgi:hypothetical protein
MTLRSRKLTARQQDMIDRLRSAGGVEVQPVTGDRMSVIFLSAWHRTAHALQDKGLVVVERSGGNMYRVRLVSDRKE